MKKKFVSIVLAALMVVTMTAGCGKSEPKAPVITASPASNSGTENQTGTGAIGDAGNQSVTPDSETPTDASKQVFTLDYGIIIFTDDSNMTAASFLGPLEYSEDYITIADEVNGLALTFAVTELSDGEIEIDMGDLGVARVAIQTKPILMMQIKKIIEEYTLVA